MTNVFLIPVSGSEEVEKHYRDTILNYVELQSLRDYISESDYNLLEKIYPNGLVKIWGTRAGDNNRLAHVWEKMMPDDYVLIFSKKRLNSITQISYTIHNEKLAEHLWKRNVEGDTWEYIFFLYNFKEGSMDQEQVWNYLDYEPKFTLRGLIKANPEKIFLNNSSVEALIHNLDPSYMGEDLSTERELEQQEEQKAQKQIDRELKGLSGEERENKIRRMLKERSEQLQKKRRGKKARIVKSYDRDPRLSRLVKERDKFICRICGERGFEKEGGGYYIETHHIIPLEENGSDSEENMISICPNCHAKLTYGTTEIKKQLTNQLDTPN